MSKSKTLLRAHFLSNYVQSFFGRCKITLILCQMFFFVKKSNIGWIFGFFVWKIWTAGQINLKFGMQKLWILFWKIQKTLILFRQPFIVNLTVLKSGSTFFTWIQESDFCAHFIKPHSTQSECAFKTLKNTCVDNWFAFFCTMNVIHNWEQDGITIMYAQAF